MQVALGKSCEEEIADNSHLLCKFIKGQVCLFFTDQDPKSVEGYFKEYKVRDFAKAGTKATFDVKLAKGTEALSVYSHALEPYFRKLGLPTKLNNQMIELLADTFVCKKGEVLNVEQCKLLKLLGHQMADFKLSPLVMRDKKGKIKQY